MKKMRIVYRVGVALCLFAILGAIVYVGIYLYESKTAAQYTKEIQEEAYIASSFSDSEMKMKPQKSVIDFQKLSKKNREVAAWLKISDTKIDYPVMDTTDEQKYLHNNFEQQKDSHGTLFFATNCNLKNQDSNLLIYGHNMKDGSMFADLMKYEEKEYYNQHKSVYLFTEKVNYQYEVIGVFKADVSKESKEAFYYSHFIDVKQKEQFEEFRRECKKRMLYDTGEEIRSEDSFLMLSTCEYSSSHGRLVVLCKKVQNNEIK